MLFNEILLIEPSSILLSYTLIITSCVDLPKLLPGISSFDIVIISLFL